MFYQIEDERLSRTILKTRHRILEASFRLFAEEGIFKTTMVDIAVKVGLTRRTLYNHFGTKEEIAILLHRLLLEDVIQNCNYELTPEEMTSIGMRHCLLSLYKYLTEDQDRLAFTVYFDQYAREKNDLIGEQNCFVNYLQNNTRIIHYLVVLKDKNLFVNDTVSPELMAKVCFESLIAYMEKVNFREEAYREQGFPTNFGDFELLVDRFLRGIKGVGS